MPGIAGLEQGGLYYVMAGVDQNNLIGDARLVDKQVLQLGTLENQTRGGVANMLLGAVTPGATGFKLSATQILDSTLLTFGVVSNLDATDTASATSGLESQGPEKTGMTRTIDDATGSTLFDKLISSVSEKYANNKNAGGANAGGGSSGPLHGGLALAYSYTEHNVKTLINGLSINGRTLFR